MSQRQGLSRSSCGIDNLSLRQYSFPTVGILEPFFLHEIDLSPKQRFQLYHHLGHVPQADAGINRKANQYIHIAVGKFSLPSTCMEHKFF